MAMVQRERLAVDDRQRRWRALRTTISEAGAPAPTDDGGVPCGGYGAAPMGSLHGSRREDPMGACLTTLRVRSKVGAGQGTTSTDPYKCTVESTPRPTGFAPGSEPRSERAQSPTGWTPVHLSPRRSR